MDEVPCICCVDYTTLLEIKKRGEKVECKVKLIFEGEKEYKEAIQRVKKEIRDLREEVEQLNIALEKEAELLKGLR